jgi:hypothetical protein
MGEELTCPEEMQNVRKSETFESQRLLLRPSMATKTAVFKGHIRNQSLPPSVAQERTYNVEGV